MTSAVGQLSYPQPRDGELTLSKPYSEATAQMIDEEVYFTVTICFIDQLSLNLLVD